MKFLSIFRAFIILNMIETIFPEPKLHAKIGVVHYILHGRPDRTKKERNAQDMET